MSQTHFEEETFESTSLDIGLWKRIFGLLAHNKKLFYTASAFAIGEGAITATIPLLNRYVIDVFFVGQGTTQDIVVFGLLFLVLVSFQAFFIYEFIYRVGIIEMEGAYKIRQDAMSKLQNLPFSYYDKTPSGWIMARVTSDIGRLSEILSWSFIDLIWGFVMMTLVLGVMLFVNFKLALLVIAIVPLIFFVSLWFQKRMLVNNRKIRAINSQITSAFSEGIAGAKTTKTLVLESLHYDEFSNLTYKMREKSIRSVILSSIYGPLVLTLSAFGNAGIIWVGGDMVLDGVILFGTLMLFTQYADQFFEPLRRIAQIIAQLQMAQASAERVLSLLEREVELVDKVEVVEKYGTILNPKVSAYEPIEGAIEFKNVHFHYNKDEPILTNFNLKVNARERIALVGETGSGKSTIINLICRFYEPISGEICIDGADYRERSIGWLHYHLGYVLQAPHLFSGSIMENIRYGRLDATDQEVIDAAKMVDAHNFIMAFDEGYDTDVGEGGSRLSTGQKQLISFARAILVNPAIFVLDEATSSIDTETEQIIQHAIENVLKDKTSFIVAHRLSTIVNADRILVIRNGQIIEDGNHQSLLNQKGYYYELYTQQLHEDEETKLMEQFSL